MIINKKTKQPARIEDFTVVVMWESIGKVMFAKDYKRFLKWMGGQTTPFGGVFIWDLKRFLNGGDSFRH